MLPDNNSTSRLTKYNRAITGVYRVTTDKEVVEIHACRQTKLLVSYSFYRLVFYFLWG